MTDTVSQGYSFTNEAQAGTPVSGDRLDIELEALRAAVNSLIGEVDTNTAALAGSPEQPDATSAAQQAANAAITAEDIAFKWAEYLGGSVVAGVANGVNDDGFFSARWYAQKAQEISDAIQVGDFVTQTTYVSDATADGQATVQAAFNDYMGRQASTRTGGEFVYFEWPGGSGDKYIYTGNEKGPVWGGSAGDLAALGALAGIDADGGAASNLSVDNLTVTGTAGFEGLSVSAHLSSGTLSVSSTLTALNIETTSFASDTFTLTGDQVEISEGGTSATTASGARGTLGLAASVSSKSAAYTVVEADRYGLIRCTAALTLTLTAAATLGSDFVFTVKAEGGDVTVDPDGAELIDGAATLTVSDGTSAEIFCDGSGFISVSGGGGGGEITAPVVATDTSDGVKTNFILPFEPSAKAFILFIVNGVTWEQANFSHSGTTLTTTTAPEAGDVEIIIMEVTGLEEVAAGTIGAAQIDPTEVNALKALLGVPTRAIGEFFWFSGSTPPAYALALDGQTQSRSGAYADLWAFAQTSGNLAASEGAKLPGQFGPGDGSTTFTLPNLMQLDGLFVRSYDASSGRVFGDYQADAMQQITGSVDVRNETAPNASFANPVGALTYTDGAGSSAGSSSQTSSAAMDRISFDSADSPGARTADETRPKNVALLPCIVATSGIVSDVPLINAGQTVANVGELQAQVGSLFEFQRAQQNVVHTTTNAYASYTAPVWTSTTPTEIDILTTTINNVAAGNKVKITVGIFYEATSHHAGFRMTRNGSDLIRGSGGGDEGTNIHFTTAYEGTGANHNSTPHYETISFVDDNPDTGSNVYRLVTQSSNSAADTVHVNRVVSADTGLSYERGVSSMVLQEIPAYTDYNALAAARAASPTMLDALTQRVDAIEPGAIQTVTNASDVQIDLTPYEVGGRVDIEVFFTRMAPSTDGASLYGRMSTDGGASWIASGYRYIGHYIDAGVTYATQVGNNNQAYVYFFGNTGAPVDEHAIASIRIVSSENVTSYICNAELIISSALSRLWYTAGRYTPGGQIGGVNAVQFYWSSGNVANAEYYIRNNLRAS